MKLTFFFPGGGLTVREEIEQRGIDQTGETATAPSADNGFASLWRHDGCGGFRINSTTVNCVLCVDLLPTIKCGISANAGITYLRLKINLGR